MKGLAPIILLTLPFVPLSFRVCLSDEIRLESCNRLLIRGISGGQPSLRLLGDVRIRSGEFQVAADVVDFDNRTRTLSASENVVFEGRGVKVAGRKASLNIDTGCAAVENASFVSPPFYFKGKRVELSEKEEICVQDGEFTTCSLPSPHYKIKTTFLRLRPKNDLKARNIRFYLLGIPILYLPIFYKSLDEEGLGLYLRPGYTEDKGWFGRVRYGFCIGKIKNAVLFDYFQRIGLGLSVEGSYKDRGFAGRSISWKTYCLFDRTLGTRDLLRLNLCWPILKNLCLRSEIDRARDKYLRREIGLRLLLPPEEEAEYSLSLTGNTRICSLRISFERIEAWDKEEGRFVVKRVEVPKFVLDVRKTRLLPSLYFSLSSTLSNRRETPQQRYTIWHQTKSSILTRLRAGAYLTLSPSIGVRVNWQNRKNGVTDKGYPLYLYYILGTILNIRPAPGLVLTTDYRFERGLSRERDVKHHKISVAASFSRKTIRLETGGAYDFLSEDLEALYANLFLRGLFGGDSFLRLKYDPATTSIMNANLDFNLCTRPISFGLNGSYVRGSGGEGTSLLTPRIQFDLWRFLTFSCQFRYNFLKRQIDEEEYRIHRDLHCFEGSLSFRRELSLKEDGKIGTFSFNLAIKGL